MYCEGNGEDLSWLESESFDIINYAYVLHEMPAVNAINIINEMYRLLKPGGSMTGFEVPFEGGFKVSRWSPLVICEIPTSICKPSDRVMIRNCPSCGCA